MAGIAQGCLAFAEDLSALIDGELVPERRAEVLAHVAACASCSARLGALRGVDRALADLPSPAVAPDLRARLERRIQAEGGAGAAAGRAHWPRPPSRRIRRAVPLLALPAAAAAALALYLVWRPSSPPGDASEPAPIAMVPEPAVPAPQPQIARAEPAAPPVQAEVEPAVPAEEVRPAPAEGGLEAVDAEDLAVVLDLDTIEDLPVIANLEVLERLLQAEAG